MKKFLFLTGSALMLLCAGNLSASSQPEEPSVFHEIWHIMDVIERSMQGNEKLAAAYKKLEASFITDSERQFQPMCDPNNPDEGTTCIIVNTPQDQVKLHKFYKDYFLRFQNLCNEDENCREAWHNATHDH